MHRGFITILLALIFAAAFGAAAASAAEIETGKPLPLVEIEKRGLLVQPYRIRDGRMEYKENGRVTYRKWESDDLNGRVRMIYHLAARRNIEKINEPFMEALDAADLPETLPGSPFKRTIILNTGDAFWGAGGMASVRFAESDDRTAYFRYVNDEEGVAREIWGLEKKSSAVIVLDPKGNVIFFKDGRMTWNEIQTAVNLIREELRRMP